MTARSVSLLLFTLAAACGANQSDIALRDTVLMFNEGVRWGRLQDVMPHVHPESSEHFVEMHKELGKEIQISDLEIINVAVSEDKQKADVNVQMTWYRLSQMEIFTTILVQHWEKQGQNWMLVAEELRSGEPF